MRVTMRFPAPAGGRLEQQTMEASVGQVMPVSMEEEPLGMATVVACEVADDGSAATMTLDLPDDPRLTGAGPFGLGGPP